MRRPTQVACFEDDASSSPGCGTMTRPGHEPRGVARVNPFRSRGPAHQVERANGGIKKVVSVDTTYRCSASTPSSAPSSRASSPSPLREDAGFSPASPPSPRTGTTPAVDVGSPGGPVPWAAPPPAFRRARRRCASPRRGRPPAPPRAPRGRGVPGRRRPASTDSAVSRTGAGSATSRLPVAPHPVPPVEPVEGHEGLAAGGHELHRTQRELDVLRRGVPGQRDPHPAGLRARSRPAAMSRRYRSDRSPAIPSSRWP